MGIGYRIKEAREQLGLTQTELGQKVGVTGSAITNYEKETSHPKEQVIYKLMEVLDIDANYLFQDCMRVPPKKNDINLSEYEHIKKYRDLDDDGRKNVDIALDRETNRVKALREAQKALADLKEHYAVDIEYRTKNDKATSLRLYTYLRKIACAGTGFTFDEIPTDQIAVPYMEGADFVIGVNGDSMEPDYHDGDKVYVKKSDSLNNGDIGIFTVGNTCFIKELGEEGLISHNKEYEDIPGTEDVRLIGKVIGKVVEPHE